MEEIEDANTRKRLRDNVGQDGAGRFGVHGLDLGHDVEELGEGIDGDEDVGDVKAALVPEKHPCWTLSAFNPSIKRERAIRRTADAHVAESIVGNKAHWMTMSAEDATLRNLSRTDLVQLIALAGLPWI